MLRASLLLLCLAVASPLPTHGAPRSAKARAEFKRLNPCPATGKPRGSCPGWVIDHVHPLCAGGVDAPSNMQWQTVEDAKAKDRAERAMCTRR